MGSRVVQQDNNNSCHVKLQGVVCKLERDHLFFRSLFSDQTLFQYYILYFCNSWNPEEWLSELLIFINPESKNGFVEILLHYSLT